jgi:hypothetical protein
MRRRLGCITLVGAVLLACGGAQTTPPPPQPNPSASGCGIRVFPTPACQAALDSTCCPLEIECAKDALCVAFMQCADGCKATGRGQSADTCTNACGLRARFAYCENACRGQSNDCPTICAQRGGPAEPVVKWALIAECSKGVRYPDGLRCDDHP